MADEQVNVVRMFDAAGEFLRDVGRAGQGPGEYSRIVGMKVLSDGRLAIRDVGNARIALFSGDGKNLGEIRVDSSSWGSNSLEYDIAGNVYVRGVRDRDAPENEWRAVLQAYSPGGERLEDIPLPAPDEAPSGRWFVLQTSQGVLRGFSTATLYDWSPLGYLVRGRNDRYEISLGGDDAAVALSRDVQRVPLSQEERRDWQAISAYVGRQYREQGVESAMRPLPEVKPVFQGLYVGEDGRIWVHHHVEATRREVPPRTPGTPPLNWREPVTFDVFEPTGVFLGTVVLPQDVRVLVWRGNQMWRIHLDADYVERVVRLRVEPEASGDSARRYLVRKSPGSTRLGTGLPAPGAGDPGWCW